MGFVWSRMPTTFLWILMLIVVCVRLEKYIKKAPFDENESRDSFVVIDANYVFVNNILELFVVTHTDGNSFVDVNVSIFVDQK